METVSGIDGALCTRCGRCVRVCPSHIFAMGTEGVYLQNSETCIFCGHCVDACADNAVIHPAFPPEKVHPIDYTRLPAPESLMELIKARRSNRAFTKKPVPPEVLRQI
ncbi:MAG: 4Fe-4S binding protein, partial [Rikenellaceae bacterium]|nr:4Fe-4S binding protein [Rikenellaceae bacterium]